MSSSLPLRKPSKPCDSGIGETGIDKASHQSAVGEAIVNEVNRLLRVQHGFQVKK